MISRCENVQNEVYGIVQAYEFNLKFHFLGYQKPCKYPYTSKGKRSEMLSKIIKLGLRICAALQN